MSAIARCPDSTLRLGTPRLCLGGALVLLAAIGCNVRPNGEFESVGTGGAEVGEDEGDEGNEDGFPPDEVACNFALGVNPLGKSTCTQDVQCCDLPRIPAGSLVGPLACPSTVFPNNWSCESGVCRQRSSPNAPEGCFSDEQCTDLMGPAWMCAIVDDVGHCVVGCSSNGDVDCQNANMPNSTCETVGTWSFCMQQPP